MRLSLKNKVTVNSVLSILLAFGWTLTSATLSHATCVNPGQEASIAAAQRSETSSPVVTVIEACGGDDTSYQIPLSVDVTFDGQVFEDVYVTTNSVITFGRPDGTYWDYPRTPSISLYSTDWVIYPQARPDEHLIISTSDGGFQVDISARPIWLQSPQVETTNITITAAILSDGTVAMAYTIGGPTYDGQTRTGVRLNDGSVVTLDQYGIEQLTESPTLSPEPTTESPFVPEPPTISPQPEPTPDPSESPSISPQPQPEPTPTISPTPTQSPEPTTSPTPTPSPEPQQPSVSPPFIPNGASVYSEGQVAEIIAPEGQRIASILGYYGDPSDSRNGQDVSPTLSQFAGSQSAIIQANNELFGDPAPGVVKIMILLVTYESIPVNEATDTQSPEPTSSPVPQPNTSPEAPQTTPTPEPSATEQPSPSPSPEPIPSPEPTSTPITPDPTPTTQPEPEPQPTQTPEQPETPQPEPEETSTPEPTPSPSVEPEPEPEPSEPSPTPEPSPEEPLEEESQPEPTPTETETSEPEPSEEPEPTEEPSSTPEPESTDPEEPIELKEEISSDNILALTEELANIEPTELTASQAEEIKEAALEVFESAEQGSAEYEAALDALLVVAQADDIVIDEELAAVPLVGAAVVALADAFNSLGNAGADMSPKVREQSEKVVIAAVIVGQVAMTATAAATSAAASAGRRP